MLKRIIPFIALVLASPAPGAVDVGKWLRHELALDASCPGNPDEIELQATFTHQASGTSLTLPGFYSGSGSLFKVNFMPTELGLWTWTTLSPDCPALSGLSSPADGPEINAVPTSLPDGSPHPGMLRADPAHPRKWQLSDSQEYVIPLGFRSEIFFENEASESAFTAAADFIRSINGTYIDLRLTDEEGFYPLGANNGNDRHDYIFCCGEANDWQNHDFDEVYWDRLQTRLDILAARGIGVQVMLYSDDSGTPAWCGPSAFGVGDCVDDLGATEDLVIRHAVARLAAYPTVMFNYIIDQQEDRDATDVNHFVDTVRALDPYGHPVSNRHGKSGTTQAANQSYHSDDGSQIELPGFRQLFANASVPVSLDDSWNERLKGECTGSCGNDCVNVSKQNRPEQLRRAAWKGLVAGGVGGQMRGAGLGGPTGTACDDDGAKDGGYFWLGDAGSGVSRLEQDLDSEQWLSLVNPFLRDYLGRDFATMEPDGILGVIDISPGVNEYALLDSADPVKVLFYSIGTGDDNGNGNCCSTAVDDDDCDMDGGGSVTLDLRDLAFDGRLYTATWFDPRTGVRTAAGSVAGGALSFLTPPHSADDDWVLLLVDQAEGGAPSAPMSEGSQPAPGSPGSAGDGWARLLAGEMESDTPGAAPSPVVDAGPDQQTSPGLPGFLFSVFLQGAVVHNGLPDPTTPIPVSWSVVAGPGTVSFVDPSSPATRADFSIEGSYTLRLTADNGSDTGSDDLVVTIGVVSSTLTSASSLPPDGALVSPRPTLELDCPSPLPIEGQVMIATDATFTNVVYESDVSPNYVCGRIVPTPLSGSTEHWWVGRMRDSDGLWSPWSAPTSFTTLDPGQLMTISLRDGEDAYGETEDTDIRGYFPDPSTTLNEWNQGARDVLRTGRREPGSPDELYRSMIRFDLSSLSDPSLVVNAYIELVGWKHDKPLPDFFHGSRAFHMLLAPWGEGQGIAEPPASGEASWTYAEFPTTWAEPGAGALDSDRASAPMIRGRITSGIIGHHTMWSSQALVDAVRAWIDDPTANHGFMLLAEDESAQFVLNLGSREHADVEFRPRLVIEQKTATCLSQPDATLCDDGNPCTSADQCLAGDCVGSPVATGTPCDDGLFCNGAETCLADVCQPGSPPLTSDGVSCTVDTCDEATDTIVHSPDHVICDNGVFCDGAEICDPIFDCQTGNAPCPGEACEEDCGACVDCLSDTDCDDGLYCNGAETCRASSGVCRSGNPPQDDGVSCTDDICDEATETFVNTPSDANCDNGLYCDGNETCDPVLDCQAGISPVADDGVSCTDESCDEATDSVLHTPNDSNCDNGLFCDGAETCDPALDCQVGPPPECLSCVVDAECDDTLFCNGAETCVAGLCEPGLPPSLDDGVSCTDDSCDELADTIVHTVSDANCDNGLFCDGAEICDPAADCLPGTPPLTTDGVSCTVDSCDEATDTIVNAADDASCDNGVFCDGAETCDPLLDCVTGTPPGCLSCQVDLDCDDGLFCNGAETCVAGLCEPGSSPPSDDGIGCTDDTCDETTDTIIHTVNDSRCDNGLFCDGVETCDPVLDCRAGSPPFQQDGVSCTDDSCDETTDTILHTPNDANCDDGLSCDPETVIAIAPGTYDLAAILTQAGSSNEWVRYRPAVPGTVTIRGGGEVHRSFVILDGFFFDAGLDPDPVRRRGVDIYADDVRIENARFTGVNSVHNGYNTNDTDAGGCKEFDFGQQGHGIAAKARRLVVFNSVVSGFRIGITITDFAEAEVDRSLFRNNFNGVGFTGTSLVVLGSAFWDTPNHQFSIQSLEPGSIFRMENTLLANTQDMVKAGGSWDGVDTLIPLHNTFWAPPSDPCGEMAGVKGDNVRVSTIIRNNIFVNLRNAVLDLVTDDVSNLTSDFNLIYQHEPQPQPDEFRIDTVKSTYEKWVSQTCALGRCQDLNSLVRQQPSFVDAPDYTLPLPDPGTEENQWGWRGPTTLAEARLWLTLTPGSPGKSAASDGQDIGILDAPLSTAACGDGPFCTSVETCDPILDCRPGGERCPGEQCDEDNRACVECLTGTDCDDGLFCNGTEGCAAGMCQAGTPPVTDDGVACTDDSCDEATDSIIHTANDEHCDNGLVCDGTETCDPLLDCQGGGVCVDCVVDIDCDDGLFCNGAEVCTAGGACIPGAPPLTDDGIGCTDDGCDEATDSVVNTANNSTCDNGLFCDGTETCDPVLDCQPGTLPVLDDGVACTDDSCDEATDTIVNTANDGNCDNSLFCDGTETCDPALDCQAGTDPCPGQACDDAGDVCVECLTDPDCGDGLFCNGGETCVAGSCQAGTPPVTDDGVACTDDSCDEATDTVVNTPNDGNCDNSLFCDGAETCDPALDCQAGTDPCPGQACDDAGDVCVECLGDPDCDDGLFCNGGETCVANVCAPGTPPTTDDGVACTDDSCDEATDTVVNTPNDAGCDNGLFCDGAETCDPALDCQAGTPPATDDGVACTDDSCDEATDCTVVNTPNDAGCDNGLFCDGAETCDPALDCQAGTPPVTDDGVACTDDSCDEATDSIVNTPNDAACDDGLFCDGTETCDPALDCQAGTGPCPGQQCDDTGDVCVECLGDPDCDDGLFCNGGETCVANVCEPGTPPVTDDGIACTDDSCDEATDTVVNTPNDATCDNGLYCDGAETCDPALDCQAGTPPVTDDGVACTDDSCDEATDAVVNTPNDAGCDNGLFCDGTETCDPVLDCQAGTGPCPGQQCDDTGDVCVECLGDPDCDDGLFCNGGETCVANVCEPGTPPVTDDGIACTDDSCDEATDTVVNLPNDAGCDNGLFCDGAETCDPALDCQAGTPPATDDGVACTDDSCDEATDTVVNTPNDAGCDNGLFCDGAETCDPALDCQAGTPPVTDDGVACTDDSCDEATDSIVNTPNDSACDDGLFCDGTETCDPALDCQAGTDPCPGQACDDAGDVCVECLADPDCDDGLFCNGGETCVAGSCQAGTPPTTDDGVACTDDSCDEATDTVVNTPNDGNCDNSLFCDGAETCDPALDCQAGTPPVTDDGVACTDDSCDEATDAVVNTPNDAACDNGLFCDGAETCDPALDCQAGTDPCPGQQCDDTGDVCVECLDDPDCDDGLFCNGGETCVANVCEPGTPPTTDDGVACTDDSCDEATDTVVNTPNDGNCDNSLFCDGAETCDPALDCQAGTPPVTDDGVACTDDSCDEATDTVVNTPNDAGCDNGLFCDGTETCDPTLDCLAGTDPCPGQACDDAGDVCVECLADPDCDDGLFCNGGETCVAGSCQAGTPPTTDDGVACTDDSCDEATDTVVNTPKDGNCDNGLFCDGTETCDPALDCQAGTPPTTDDGVACTDDSCDEATDTVVNTPNDGNCDNSLFCDGTETCDPALDCQAGTPPVTDDGVACTDDSCDEATDTVVNTPNDAGCDNGLFCDGTETCDPALDCQAGTDPCPGQACDDAGDVCVECLTDPDCDDGLFCNGGETCVAGSCQAGTPPATDDGVACTDDSCDEATDTVVNTPNDGNCDNSLFCDGTETCDPALDCQAGTPPATDDGVACTDDSCDEATDAIVNTPNHAACDNGLSCDGTEVCDPALDCQGSGLVCSDPVSVARWPLDEGSGPVAGDVVGISDGTITGAAWVAGVSGMALDFNGNSDHVVMANAPALDITGTAITLAAWIYPNDGGISGGSRVISKRTDQGGSDVYAMYTQNNRLRFRLDGQDLVSAYVFNTNEWLHAVMTYDGVDKRIYVNGVLDTAPPQSKTDTIDGSSRPLHLGMRDEESRYFDGLIDEVEIYDRALTPEEVVALFNSALANSAPAVDAGIDVTIRLPDDVVVLDGTVIDDNQPIPLPLTTWSGPAGVTFDDASVVDATATFPGDGTYVLQLTADDTEFQTSDTVTVTVQPASVLTSIAVVPATATLAQAAVQQFTATGTDQYDEPFTPDPVWSTTGDGTIDQTGRYTAGTTAGVYTVTATDGAVIGTAAVTVTGSPPVAQAGGPYAGDEGSAILLDGSGSTDNDDDIVAWEWDLDDDGTYDDAAGATAVFSFTDSGVFTIGLRVTDSEGADSTDGAVVTVDNVAPSADAGGPYAGDQGSGIPLDASASSDPGNDIVGYGWDFDTDGTYDDASGAAVVFNAVAPGAVTVGLRVTDADGATGTATADVTVNDVPPDAPLNLDASSGNGQVTLDWDDRLEPDLAGYNVSRSQVQGGPYTEIVSLVAASDYLDTAVSNGTTYYYVVTAEDLAGGESPPSGEAGATPGALVPVAYWAFDEGSGPLAADSAGNSDGTVVGAGWVPGVAGTALDFNGSSDHVVMADTPALDITGTAITLAAWIYPHDGGISGGSRVISRRTDQGGSDVYAMYTQRRHLRFRLDGQDLVSAHELDINEWVHVVMTYDGVDKRIYVNGVLDTAPPQSKTDTINGSSRPLHLGMRDEENRYFDGLMDEVQIYDRALTPEEVQTLFNSVP